MGEFSDLVLFGCGKLFYEFAVLEAGEVGKVVDFECLLDIHVFFHIDIDKSHVGKLTVFFQLCNVGRQKLAHTAPRSVEANEKLWLAFDLLDEVG